MYMSNGNLSNAAKFNPFLEGSAVYKQMPLNPAVGNVDSSSWAGNFTSNVVPVSSLSGLVPQTNALAAAASALKMSGGGKRRKNSFGSKKYNMRKYNRMSRHTRTNYRHRSLRRKMTKNGSSKRVKRSVKRSVKHMSRSRRMRGGRVGQWITGVAANTTSYETPAGPLPSTESALANGYIKSTGGQL